MIREGETGFVRPAGDVTGLAERVIAILKNHELRQRLALGAKEAGRQEFALGVIAGKTAEVYQEILSG